MKRLLSVLLVIAVCGLAWLAIAAAQDQATGRTNIVEQSRIYLHWMQAMADKLENALNEARREQNSRKIDCIGDRLATINKLIVESQGIYQRIRAFSVQQRTDDAKKQFGRLEHNQGLVQQLLELVDNCFHNINEEGGFVETVEEWLGDPENLPPEEPEASEEPVPPPEPVPNEFTPGPVSEEDEM